MKVSRFSAALLGLYGHFVLAASPMAVSSAAVSSTVIVQSPNQQITIEVTQTTDGAPAYSIMRNGVLIIAPSRLRLQLADDKDFYAFDVVDTKTRTVDERYQLIAAKTSAARDHFNEAVVSLREKGGASRRLHLIFRAYDDGVAFRYLIPQQGGFEQLRLQSEETQFVFPEDYACYGLNIGRVNLSHEGEFDPVRAGMIREHNMYDSPLTCQSSSGNSAFAIIEADLRDWGGMYLSRLGNGDLGVSTRISRRIDGSGLTVSRAMTPEGIQSPWRVLLLGDSHGKLIESNLITSLNPPTQLQDISWIKPGKTAWDWWSGPYLPPPLKGGTDMRTIKRYIDFAGASGFAYMLIDEGWCLNSGVGGSAPANADIARTKPDLNMPELVNYAAKKGVGLWLWVQWSLLDRQMDEALAQYEQWGIKGIKVDFMDRNDQQMVDYYHRVMSKAAAHKLMVNMHGAYPPTGLYRTYPNYLTQEGVMGAEYNKWSRRVTATHNVTLAYTRNLLGAMDYTPGGFRNVTPAAFKPVNSPPLVQTTRGQALAMYVVYDSPLQMVSDSPDAYENAAGFDFIKAVTTMWDETRFIEGEIAQYIVVARRKGEEWYVAAMNNEQARTVQVPLAFLRSGSYRLKSWQDGSTPTSLAEAQREKVTSADNVSLELAASGGAVVRIVPNR